MYNTPYISFKYDRLIENYKQFRRLMPRVNIAYAIKSNSNADVIRSLAAFGSGFDVASLNEVHHVRACGINASTSPLYYSNPIRSNQVLIKSFQDHQVQHFVVDSIDGVLMLKDLPEYVKRNVKFYIRLYVSNNQSILPLNSKFGVDINDVESMLTAANEVGVNIMGVSFHVGSQCMHPSAFFAPIEMASHVLDLIKYANPNKSQHWLLDIGGGFPAVEDDSFLDKFAKVINGTLENFDNMVDVIAEPGRRMVSNAGTLYTTVVLIKAHNRTKPFAYLDSGVYQGLLEFKQGMNFNFKSDRDGELMPWILAGPTCDSFDIVGEVLLPNNLQVGDVLTMDNAGAYVSETGTCFNGFIPPNILRDE